MVVRNGLDFQVGVGGARLAAAERQKVALIRALLKRPVLLVLDQAAALLDPVSQKRVVQSVLAERKDEGVIWVLSRPEYAESFAQVLVMERGRLVESGAFSELKRKTG
jgi:putative ABC transport system ATP-binding protein